MKSYMWVSVCILMFNLKLVLCYLAIKSDSDAKLNKDEKRYPNGTVIGKYSYTDSDGNPIQVKYYADDSSYGVELKSVKVMSDTSDNTLLKETGVETLLQSTEMPFGFDLYNPTNTKSKIIDQMEILNKDNKNSYKTSPDYETYFQNELKTPNKCGKDKVRVYLNKEKRKARQANDYIEAVKYCNQF